MSERLVCTRCDFPAEAREPMPLCRLHAIEFFAGLVAVGAATARVHRRAPGCVDVVEVVPVHLRPRKADLQAIWAAERAERDRAFRQALVALADDLRRLQNGREVACRRCGWPFLAPTGRSVKSLCDGCISSSHREASRRRWGRRPVRTMGRQGGTHAA